MNLDHLRAALAADRAAGVTRPLREYLDRFPGNDNLVAREFLAAAEAGTDGAKRIGPYRLVRELGRGGQAIVYLADDTRISRQVALKVLPPVTAEANNDVVLARFRREAEVSSHLDHPGICGILEADVVRGIPYIAMRFVPGETLARRITAARDARQAPPDPRQLVELAALGEKVARALHAAHEVGVTHRDIKPANVMVTPEGEPVVLDFGLARQDDAATQSLSLSGDVSGTPAYMSPEQMTGKTRPDRRADVWALGVLLQECATLEHPFAAATRESLFQAILHAEPPDPRRRNGAIDRDLATIFATAMAKERDQRYQTAQDLAEDLRRWRHNEPIRARPVGPLARVLRWAQRNPALATSLGAIACLLLLASGLLSYGLGASGKATVEAQLRSLADRERSNAEAAQARAEADRTRMAQEDKDRALGERCDELSMQLGTLAFGMGDRGEALGVLGAPFLRALATWGIDLEQTIDVAHVVAELEALAKRKPSHWRAVNAGLANFGLVVTSAPASTQPRVRQQLLAILAALPRLTWPELDEAVASWREHQRDEFHALLTDAALADKDVDQLTTLAGTLSGIEARMRDVLAVLDRALRLAPDSFRLHFMRFGIAFKTAIALPDGDDKQRLLDECLLHMRIAVALRPRSGFVRALFATTLAVAGQYREAMTCIDEATRLEPEVALVWLLAARFYSRTPTPQRGIDACHKALALDPALLAARTLLTELEQR